MTTKTTKTGYSPKQIKSLMHRASVGASQTGGNTQQLTTAAGAKKVWGVLDNTTKR